MDRRHERWACHPTEVGSFLVQVRRHLTFTPRRTGIMNAIEMLEEQHRDVEDLFEEIEEAEGAEKQEVFAEIADQLVIHSAIEEKHFYPAVKARQTEDLLRESLEEH